MLRLLTALLAALLIAPAAASAHAQLLETAPERGAVLDAVPAEVAFFFDEPVEAAFGAVRVYDARGERVDDGTLSRPGGESSAIGVGVRPGLDDGTYTATYRVVSADSHPVSGGFTFVVGDASTTTAATVSELLDDADASPTTTVAFGVARGLGYAAIAVGVGGLVFLLAVWLPALGRVAATGGGWPDAARAFTGRLRALLLAAAAGGLVATAAGIAFQGAVAGGTSVWAALDPGVVGDVLGTRYGEASAARLGGWVAFAALVAPALRRERPAPPLLAGLAVASAALVVTPGLGGHAGTTSPAGLVLTLDVLHVLAMSAWLGGLALLLAAVPAATRRLEGADRTRLLAAVVERFTTVAIAAVAVLLLTGIVQSVVHLDAVDELWTSAFGRAILIKAALLAGLVALGAVNRQRVRPRLRALAAGGELPGGAGRLLRSTLRAEIGLAAAVLGVTAALVSYAPASAGAGLLSESAALGPARLELTVEPLRAGPQELHLYLLDGGSGAPWTQIEEVTASLEQRDKEVGPLDVRLREAGPGHYIGDAVTLAIAGDWTLRVDLRASRFDAYSAEVEVPIR